MPEIREEKKTALRRWKRRMAQRERRRIARLPVLARCQHWITQMEKLVRQLKETP